MADELNGWHATKQRIQQRWPALGDDELDESQGDRSALVALLEGRLGYARTNAEQDIDEILSGETVIPEDVADETTDTVTSGPVGPVSAATDFTGAHSRSGDNNNPLNHGPAPTHGQSQASTTDVSSDLSDYREPWQMGAPSMSGASAGIPPAQYPPRSAGRARMMKAAGIVAAAAALLFVGIWLKGRKQHRRTNTEQLVHQVRGLGDTLSERAPNVDEVRNKLPSADARMLMSPKASGLIGAAVTLLSACVLMARRRRSTRTERVVRQADELSGEISELMTKLEALQTDLRSLEDDARGKKGVRTEQLKGLPASRRTM